MQKLNSEQRTLFNGQRRLCKCTGAHSIITLIGLRTFFDRLQRGYSNSRKNELGVIWVTKAPRGIGVGAHERSAVLLRGMIIADGAVARGLTVCN